MALNDANVKQFALTAGDRHSQESVLEPALLFGGGARGGTGHP